MRSSFRAQSHREESQGMSKSVKVRDGNRITGDSYFAGRERLVAGALLLAVLLAYQPVWQGGFIWDDNAHVTRSDLQSWQGLGRIWFQVGATLQYYPLLHSAFWFEHRLWGDAPLGYHLVNILLHGISAILVLLILRRLAVPGAYLAAAIFALHPVQVESVAWITEQKNTLSAVFYLGALLAYLHFDQTRRKSWYLGALLLFVLGVLSKTVVGTLPGALLVVFWWQRGRLSWTKDVLPLVPLFLLGAGGGLITAWWEVNLNRCVGPEYDVTLAERFLIAGRAVWFYLWKLFWPLKLTFIYPRWRIDSTQWWQYVFLLGVAALLAALWAIRRWTRAPLAAVLFFAGTLFPVLGFFNLYASRYSFVANHYQYLASLGIITLVSAGVALLLARWRPASRPAGWAVCLMLLAALAILTWRQSGVYADVETLYQTTIDENPDCWMAYNNLANAWAERGKLDEAVARYRQALTIKPDYVDTHVNLGVALERQGHASEALDHYRKALEIDPRFINAYVDLGAALERQGRLDEAAAQYRKALELDPDSVGARVNLGVVLRRQGRLDEAVAQYQKALAIRPNYAEAHVNLGAVLGRQGKFDEAAAHFREALAINPSNVLARRNLDSILVDEQRALEALAAQRALTNQQPDNASLLNDIAWVLATSPHASLRNGEDAIELAQRAWKISGGGEPAILGTLAAAYAEAGRFPEAVETARKAIALAGQQKKQRLLASISAKLPLYQAGTAYRQPPALPAPQAGRP
jgi:tetratricopeptide (TPR) repeat protein